LSPTQRLNACRQLSKRKRLGEIIIGTQLEAADAVVEPVARGEHENRRGDPTISRQPAEIEPAAARKHEIENDDIVRAEEQALATLLEVARAHAFHPLLAEPPNQNTGEPFIVFDDENLQSVSIPDRPYS
jgi:hypothetical protein